MEKNLTNALNEQLLQLDSFRNKTKKKIVFTVGNTRVLDNSNYYLTPIRIVDDLIIAGVVLFSELEGKTVFELIDGRIDYIFVDCEKKSKNMTQGFFNLERLSVELIRKSKLNFYKGNDITVDSIDSFVFQYYKSINQLIGGKNILIVGIGNIGFKIALKLVERGANVFLKSRDNSKSNLLINSINCIKPRETISKVDIHSNNINYSTIILTHLKPLPDNLEIFENLTNKTTVIDVGKGCLSKDQIAVLNSLDITPFRLDIGDTFINHIRSNIDNEKKFIIPRKKSLLCGHNLIEPGIIGNKNDVVVDSIKTPSLIYGVCDGFGGFENNKNKVKILKQIKNEYNINYGM